MAKNEEHTLEKNDKKEDTKDYKKLYEELLKDSEITSNQLRILQSDFDNYKKRALKENIEAGDSAAAELISKLLPEIDVFRKALEVSEDEGFKMIFKNMMKTLEKEGLKEIKTAGEKFDINLHEALVCVDDKTKADGMIVDEVEKGYTFKGKVIKHSKVIVNKKE